MSTHLSEVFAADEKSILEKESNRIFSELIQSGQYVGDVYSISYQSALVQIHDKYRQDVGGIPSLCFLIATRVDPTIGQIDFTKEDSSIILLRVMDSSPLPNNAEAERIRVEVGQRVAGTTTNWDTAEAMDAITANLLSFAGVKCRVVGTFFLQKGKDEKGLPTLDLKFGSDLSNYYPNRGLKVYKPNAKALEKIVNYRDPDRLRTEISTDMVQIGEVRYASTNRDYQAISNVPVSIMPADLLSQKTALFGMTRSGKSNTTKIIVKAVFDLRYQTSAPRRIGQLIFDANGEYANENTQDTGGERVKGAIKNLRDSHPKALKEDVVTYGIMSHPSDPDRILMLLNFYLDENLQTGKDIIDGLLEESGITSIYVKNFLQVNFEIPDPAAGRSEITRFKRRKLAYQALLKKAGFQPSPGLQPDFMGLFSDQILEAMMNKTEPGAGVESTPTKFVPKVNNSKDYDSQLAAARMMQLAKDEVKAKRSSGLTWDRVTAFFEALQSFIKDGEHSGFDSFNSWYMNTRKDSSGEAWADDGLKKVLTMFAQPNGSRLIGKALPQHTPLTSGDYADEIYKYLVAGKLVIVDQSSGEEDLNRSNAARLMERIFRKNQQIFRQNEQPPDILIYIEEAHTILPPGSETDTSNIWAKTAKEGAKLHLGMVYATQEVSSIQKNILKNTSNFLISHLNNTDETQELCKYYEFLDFEESIRRAQDKGFLRVKTLSNYFIIPVQIKLFEV